MNRIAGAFAKGKAFIGFITGGDPSIEKSEDYIVAMIRSGADLVEIGIPFSDPIAEGPVIQAANVRALAAGATVEKIFGLAESVRRRLRAEAPDRAETPLVFLTYLNPVFCYGYDAFFARCARTGVDGLIIPDLPFEEQAEVKAAAAPHGTAIISLIAPTSCERIRAIAENAEGFVYLVSSMGVTGIRGEINTDLPSMIAAVKAAAAVPAAVGFGIHTPEQAADIARFADGVITGSAIVKMIGEDPAGAEARIAAYAASMKAAVMSA